MRLPSCAMRLSSSPPSFSSGTACFRPFSFRLFPLFRILYHLSLDATKNRLDGRVARLGFCTKFPGAHLSDQLPCLQVRQLVEHGCPLVIHDETVFAIVTHFYHCNITLGDIGGQKNIIEAAIVELAKFFHLGNFERSLPSFNSFDDIYRDAHIMGDFGLCKSFIHSGSLWCDLQCAHLLSFLAPILHRLKRYVNAKSDIFCTCCCFCCT